MRAMRAEQKWDVHLPKVGLDRYWLAGKTRMVSNRSAGFQPGALSRPFGMNTEFRIETDSMGQMQVPAEAYYGAQTARAIENFPISDLRFPRSFIRAMGLIKKHSAVTNTALGLLPAAISEAIQKAAQEVIEGRLDLQFPLDIFQTGSGTSTNMNANEVIANRANEIRGWKRGDKSVHPNDHVNCGQSSNNAIPTAIHLA